VWANERFAVLDAQHYTSGYEPVKGVHHQRDEKNIDAAPLLM
jgi:hypothetical protein